MAIAPRQIATTTPQSIIKKPRGLMMPTQTFTYIRHAEILSPDALLEPGDVQIQDGTIVAVGADLSRGATPTDINRRNGAAP
jgi:hypothetical protein